MLQMPDVDRSNHCWLAKAALAILALACLVLGPARPAAAAETNKPPKLPSQRYLLIVETSRAMRGRMDNVIPIIRDLLAEEERI